MKTQYKNFIGKVSQAGSLMVEAMAMLALISLVTPTLYKKSAERTTELQDINTATHMRTIMKAVDNYVSANYESLVDGELQNDGDIKKINLSDGGVADGIHDYFPYGYKFDQLKNFETPKITLKKQGMSITSFVELPKKLDIGEMRAARIASMVGSNGGYVNGDKRAQGVGGIWSLEEGDLTNLGFTGGKGSIVVASSEAINTASSGALENEKYLQRTKVESDDQLWRNTMVTDLYMGGVQDANEMYKILGVQQLILGSTEDEGIDASLIVRANNSQDMNGSAWIENTLSAMSDAFVVSGTAEAPVLSLASVSGDGANEILHADETTVAIHGTDAKFEQGNKVSFYDGKVVLSNVDDGDVGAKFEVNTEITKKLDVSGSTAVAKEAGTEFTAGQDGKYIKATENEVNLLNGNVKITAGSGETPVSETTITSKKTTITSDNVQIDGKTKIGTGKKTPGTTIDGKQMEVQLDVQGNAFVSDTLEAWQVHTRKFRTLELHAGGNSYDENKQWLHAMAGGVLVHDPDDLSKVRLEINNTGDTGLYNQEGRDGASSAVVLGDTDAQLRGETEAKLYTTGTGGTVNIQDGALILTGKTPGDAPTNDITMKANTVSVNNGALTLQGIADQEIPSNTIGMDAQTLAVNSGTKKLAEITTSKAITDPDVAMGLTDKNFSLSDNKKRIVEVSLDSGLTETDESETAVQNRGSVYIRRGAIEIEQPSGSWSRADKGYGYIEAGRFVSNAYEPDGTTLAGVKENESSDHVTGTKFDRYMVNPAYTSVMHDIKLTTRGGARLSDILPDFINKGIYVVNNTYKDTGFDIQKITVKTDLSATADKSIEEISGTLSGANQWASPFLGVVPTPICPPGYARVITITPAGFMMAQAGQMTKSAHPTGSRWVVNEYSGMQDLGKSSVKDGSTVTGAQYTTSTITDQSGSEHELYYLGHAMEPTATITDSNGITRPYSPQPLYFQQSTWLKSMVIPQSAGQAGSCNPSVGSGEGCSNFVGWSTIMGFAYPGSFYKDVIKQITGEDADDASVYWNVFPVRAQTLEAYATVYCYFDRTNLYGSGNDPKYVDPYDQLNKFYDRKDKKHSSGNAAYLERLNDPTLKYSNPW